MQWPPILIVDEQDNPVGEAGMLDAWEQGLIHRIARVMVEDDKGRILLQKRAASMKLYPNCWDNSAAGHVDTGESNDIAAARELKEELGLVGDLEEAGSYFTSAQQDDKILRRFNHVYKVVVGASDKITLQSEEVSEARWFTLEEIKTLIEEHPNQVTDGLIDTVGRFYS